MLPKYHIVLGFIFASFLFFIFPEINLLGFFIIFFSSFLIDVDHYLYYVFTKRDISLKNAYGFFIKKRRKTLKLSKEKRIKLNTNFLIFHKIEFILFMFLLGSFISKLFLFVFLGMIFHLFLDIIWRIKHRVKVKGISLVYDFIKLRKYK